MWKFDTTAKRVGRYCSLSPAISSRRRLSRNTKNSFGFIILATLLSLQDFITARKRSLRRLCFYRCLSFILFTGGVCMVFFGGVCMVLFGGGHAWFHLGGMHGFIRGGMVLFRGGHAWFYSGGHAWFFQFFRIQWDTVNERAVRILLECILVLFKVFRFA